MTLFRGVWTTEFWCLDTREYQDLVSSDFSHSDPVLVPQRSRYEGDLRDPFLDKGRRRSKTPSKGRKGPTST